MTTATTTTPAGDRDPRAATRQLALVEARRMLRHPAPWLGLALSALWARAVPDDWSSAQYEGVLTAVSPLLLGLTLASASVFAHEQVPVAHDAPMEAPRRSLARLLAGLPLVAVVSAVVAGASVWLSASGGLLLGEEPGRTAHAHYSLPELVQPVLLACFAIALGAAVVHVVRQRLVASIVVFVYWFLVGGAYWMFNGTGLRWVTPLQVQPVVVDVGPPETDPAVFPAGWLLTQPGQYQDYWGRLVVSPAMAAWHDLYLVALTLILCAVAVPGRWRRPLLTGGAVTAVGAVVLQSMVAP